jgi:CheY-like chemotaxis protein/anti-sigma regulatory factor (Ser/Thr protein kinase)
VGAALTRQLLAFSRQAVVKPAPLDLNEGIRGIVRIVDRLIGEDIVIKLELTQEPAVIQADGAQVQQILLNLAVNARDAMAHGGELVFSTRESPGNPMNPGEPARWVELKVRDTGKGMDPATRERAFEPFFTTKEPGKGTGLGLSTIADIVAQMKGTISICSEPNRGTTVTIRFPHSAAKVAPPPASIQAGPGRGGESILLVEDNAELRELVRLFLASAGYRVQAVGRPGEAEALWKTEKDGIDLLITDMVMPEKSGKDLAKALLAAKPGLKTLFISGYSPSRNGFGEWGFLQKPFTRDELLGAVRTLCDRRVDRGP